MSETATTLPHSPPSARIRRQFRPNLWLTLLAVGGLGVLCYLGLWQAGRYLEATRGVDFYRQQHDVLPPVTALTEGATGDRLKTLQFRRAKLTGTLQPEHTQLLTGRIVLGQIGVAIVVPVLLDKPGPHPRLLVHLGTVPQDKVTDYLAQLKRSPPRTFEGRLQVASDRSADAKPVSTRVGLPVWQTLNPTAFAQRLPGLDPDLVLQAGAQASGKLVDPKKLPADGYAHPVRMAPSKHVEYSATWFALAATLVAVWVALGWREEPVLHDA